MLYLRKTNFSRGQPNFPLMAPQVGFEPTTRRLTADCSTTELLRIDQQNIDEYTILSNTF